MFCDSGGDHALPGAQLSALLVSMQRAGGTFGTVFAGFFPDRFGRKRSMQTVIVVWFVALIALIFTRGPASYGICLAMCEVCSGFILTVASAYGIEVIGPKWRVYFGAFGTAAYGAGFILVTIIAMFLPDRQLLTIAVASMFALNLLYMHAIPESPVWALTKSRLNVARKSIATLSETLTIEHQNEVDIYIRRLSVASQRRQSFSTSDDASLKSQLGKLFKGKLIRKFTLLTLAMHTCVTIADYGTKYYAAKLPGNIYFNNCFTGLAEFIGSLMTLPLIHRFGLKKTSTGLNMAAGVLMLLTMGLLQTPYAIVGVYMSFAAKVLNIGGWSAQVTYMAELFPSDVRTSGLALVSTCSSMCLFLAPLIVTAPWDWLPMTTFGVLSLLCGTLQWLLPDLTGVPMFMYVEDQQRYYSKVNKRDHYYFF